MIQQLNKIGSLIGNTPTVELTMDGINLYAKLEYYNFSGSIKDRPAYNIIRNAVMNGEINENSTIIESSSGNFALALASICARLGIRFIAVIDPVINNLNEKLLNLLCYRVIKVWQRDITQGYLLTRLNLIHSMCSENPDYYWTNQYENPGNYMSYYNGLGVEIGDSFENLDYAFIGVSTCGTITGLSRRLKERFPGIRIIAVDIQGSVIFGGAPQKRSISGIGASMASPVLKEAIIDEVLYVSQLEIVEGCDELLKRHILFGGGSAGAGYAAVKKYFRNKAFNKKPNVLFLCPDKGMAYLDNVYDAEWKRQLTGNTQKTSNPENYAVHS